MDLLSILVGVALVFALYFLYLAATKGVPAAWSLLKSWWNAGKAELAKVQSDLTARVTTLEGDVSSIKKALGTGQGGAPAAQTAAPSPVPSQGTAGQTTA